MTNVVALSIILTIIGLSILYSIKELHQDKNLDSSFEKVFYYFSVFISFLVMMINLNFIYVNIVKFVATYLDIKSSIGLNISKIIGLLAVFFMIQFVLNKFLNKLLQFFYSYKKSKSLKIFDYIKCIFIGSIKGTVILLIVFLGISSYNNTFTYKPQINIFSTNILYSSLNNYLSNNRSIVMYNDIKEYVPEDSVQVFYNGVPLDYGIEGNEEISNKAHELTKYLKSDIDKAKALYAWIGSNIKYDYTKADDVLNGKSNYDSGARVAWKDRSGICFDYACLYIAMAREIDLPVRLITGKASNGLSMGPHAWNQVYIRESERWINVDPTFYTTGDYFDSELFQLDHVSENIAGEWYN